MLYQQIPSGYRSAPYLSSRAEAFEGADDILAVVAALDAADRLAASRMTVVTDSDAYEVLEEFRNVLDDLIGRLNARAADIRDAAEDYLE